MFEGRDITGLDVTEVCQLGLTKSYQVNQLFTRLTVRENITIAALAEKRGHFRLDLLRGFDSVDGLDERVEDTLALVAPQRPRRRAGVRARLWRKAAARDRARARHRAEPAAARRAARRHEPARARGDGAAAQIDRPRPHHDRHRSRHGRDLRAGGTDHRAARRPRAGRRHAGRDQGQRGGAGSLSRRGARAHEPARGQSDSTATMATRTFCSTWRCGSRRTRSWRCSAATAPARAPR